MLSEADVEAIESAEQLADALLRASKDANAFVLEPEAAAKASIDLNGVVRMARLLQGDDRVGATRQ